MEPYNNQYSHTVPLPVKIICSIFIWLPVLVSFVTVWHFPNATIIYNIGLSIYIIICHLLTYATSLVIFLKQKRITHGFFHTSAWKKIKDEFKNHRKTTVVNPVENILHMVLIPIYKEHPVIIENTLKSLAEQNVSMIIGFALEEREINSDTKYDSIIKKYENQFITIIKTIHPKNFKNEVAGKPSNCNYGAQMLVKFYEENKMNLRTLYNHVMITVCDCDSIWAKDYFLYLNYLCTQNNIDDFHRIAYVPNITNMKQFQSSHIFSNWVSMIRSIGTHGHFRFLGYIRSFVSEYHIPLQLMKRIDYWDSDIVHEDIHMRNKLAILNEKSLVFKQTFMPCDNQTPTDINSVWNSFLLLWDQNVRWNSYIYELYYLCNVLLLNIVGIKHYKNFRTDSWKIIREMINNYENVFFFGMAFISNSIFWMVYICLLENRYPYKIVYHLLYNVQPYFAIVSIILSLLHTSLLLQVNDENTCGKRYSGKKHVYFLIGFIPIPFIFFLLQGFSVTIAWMRSLKTTSQHSKSAPKIVS